MARPHSSRKTAAATAGVPGRENSSGGRSAELALLALTGLVLATGTLWWGRRQPSPAPQVTIQAPAARAERPVVRSTPARLRLARVDGEAPVAPVTVAADAPSEANDARPLMEDRALGQPLVPSARAPQVRAPDPPPLLPLDPDEVVPDDPRDFELPARAARQP